MVFGGADRNGNYGCECGGANRVNLPDYSVTSQAAVRSYDGVVVPVREHLQGPVQCSPGPD